MLTIIMAMAVLSLLMPGHTLAVNNPATNDANVALEDYAPRKGMSAKEWKKHQRQLKKEQRKAEKMERKMQRKQTRVGKILSKIHEKAMRGDTSGIGLALAIILVGAVLAILGLVGVADLLISIGIIILVVGLVIWIFTSLA